MSAIPVRSGLLAMLMCLAGSAHATPIVSVVPSSPLVGDGESFTVQLIADLDEPVVGWGLDLSVLGPANLDPGPPAIGPLWTPLAAPDADGLAGQAFPTPISGTGVLLATLSFTATGPGSIAFQAEISDGDLSEGFALHPIGFAEDPVLEGATVTVLPEPAALLLLGLGALALGRRR